MTPTIVKFQGSVDEMAELYTAVVHNCTCDVDPKTGMPLGGCGAHSLLHNQRALDGLLVSRERTKELMLEELR